MPHRHNLVARIAAQLEPVYQDTQASLDAAWQLIEHITKLTKLELIMQDSLQFSPEQEKALQQAIQAITQEHTPLQYILGSVPFLDLTLTVKPPVLIPRPETEAWCAQLIEKLKPYADKKLTMLDLCTGSGCIALALAKALPQSIVYATDINPQALELAAQNAQKNQIFNAQFMHTDLYEQLPRAAFDVIVANPPYISEHEFISVEPSVKLWEDRQALVATHDGYELLERIIAQAPEYLKPKGALGNALLMVEIGYRQGAGTVRLFEHHGFTHITVEKDLNGHDRAVHGTWH